MIGAIDEAKAKANPGESAGQTEAAPNPESGIKAERAG
jgi:hypothetical protein